MSEPPHENHATKAHSITYWACPNCIYKTIRADNLQRHMINNHKWDKTSEFFKTLNHSNRKEMCRGCKRIRTNMSRHKQTCPGIKTLEMAKEQRKRPPISVYHPPIASKYVPALKDIENNSVEDCYLKFLGKCSPSTKYNYKRHLRTFFTYMEQQCPGFDPKDLFLTFTKPKEEAFTLPASFIRGFAEQCTASVLLNAMKAIASFINLYHDFVLSHAADADQRVLDQATRNIDHSRILLKNLSKQAYSEARSTLGTNRWKKRQTADLTTQPELVRMYCGMLLTSAKLKDICENLTRTSPSQGDFVPSKIRDITMMILEMTSGGLRAVSIRNLTLGEFQDRQIVSRKPLEVIMRCSSHKTAKFYGAALFIIKSPMVHDFLEKYVKYARLGIGGSAGYLQQPESPLFPSKSNRTLQSTKGGIKWARAALLEIGVENVQDPKLLSFTSAAIRKAFCDFGSIALPNGEEEKSLSKDTALHMGHSVQTADRHYKVNIDASRRVSERVHQLLFGNVKYQAADFPESDGCVKDDSEAADEKRNEPVGSPQHHQFSEGERQMCSQYFLRNRRICIDNADMKSALKNKEFENLYKKILTLVNGSDRKAKQRIRSAIRKFERKYDEYDEED
ncbi:hypothetical protein TCAL_13587 [Tigriopus californicus]|uniref:Uncharacterized protein n=1 Tax=Tigriopus californicus TaxID=6832 RepID=A0A553PIG8_TIGCA|nr:uncharacterized protein LOC131881058 [Tigriopus californicus]TRY77481.1 hypothetical protein TCAL_13587 [Tigriopus californicus]|eukprot:TCALIF_13587-PA protein Name:"Protein of unknown function" AED:0.00 eAED:0.00 QI:730/1/1/1/0.62/0.66/9/199/620